jgi:hypothetical protein
VKQRSGSLRWLVQGLAFALGMLLLAQAAHSFIPRASRIVSAIAHNNRAARRHVALRYNLSLRIEDESVASGELISHPTGMARLELRATGGLIERHLLLGNDHTAARNGAMLVRPRAFLPPLFLMQADSSATLNAALDAFGVRRNLVGLRPCGDADCYVLGVPEDSIPAPGEEASLAEPKTPPPFVEEVEVIEETEILDDQGRVVARSDVDRTMLLEVDVAPIRTHANIWVDSENFEIRRIESSDGVVVNLGPYVAFGKKLRAPEWWSIEEQGKRPVRFEIQEVASVNAAASAFGRDWMLAPVPGAANGRTPPGAVLPSP